MASTSGWLLSGGKETMIPGIPGGAAVAVAMEGRPAAAASSSALAVPSYADGRTKIPAAA